MTESNATPYPSTCIELRSTLTDDGRIVVAQHLAEVGPVGDDHVVVRVEAAPINPSDLGMLFAGADSATASSEAGERRGVALTVSKATVAAQSARIGRPMFVGNEGAGTVVAAGDSPEAQALLGKVVGFLSRNAYAEYRVLHHSQCLLMNEGTTPAEAASAFVNPLTALGMVETMRSEGHQALVHTVGASNLGLMLNRICRDDGVELVNIVRRSEQVDLLSELDVRYVCDSSSDTFVDDLAAALRATGATIAFDAIGGGELASTVLAVMERVLSESSEFSRYGSDTHKQVYIYGGLDRGPTVLHRNFGMSWSVGGWLLMRFLARIGQERADRLRQRVASEITTTFASSYGLRLTLDEAVDPEMVKRYGRMATGDKALITPQH